MMQEAAIQANSNVIPMPSQQVELPKSMFDIPGCRFTTIGLIIEKGMPIDDWVEVGNRLRKAKDSLGIWIGDWINYGKHEYGKKYQEALALTGYKEGTLRDFVWISKAVPLSVRNDKLKAKHYLRLAPLRSENRIRKWIEKTLRGDGKKIWSAERLKKEIYKATSPTTPADTIQTGGSEAVVKEPPVLSKMTRAFLDKYMMELARWAEKIPVGLPASEREALETMIYQHGADALRFKNRTHSSDREAILKVLKDTRDVGHLGEMDANELYGWLTNLRHFMSVEDYKDRLQYMNRSDVRQALLTDAGEGKQEGRKGQLPWIVCLHWAKVWKVSGKCKKCKSPVAASKEVCDDCLGEE